MRTIMEFFGKRRVPAFGAVVLAALLLATPPAPASSLTAPTLSATAGDGEVTLSWTASTDADHYQYRGSTDGGVTWLSSDWLHTGELASVREILVTNLTNGTEYTFEVRAGRTFSTFGGINPYTGLPTWQTTHEYSEPSNSVTATPTAAE